MRLMRLRLVWVVSRLVAVLVVGLTVGSVGSVGAVGVWAPGRAWGQTEIDAVRVQVADASDRVEDLLARIATVQQRGNQLTEEFWQVESSLGVIDAQVAFSQSRQAALAQERASLLEGVRAFAVEEFVNRGQDAVWADIESIADRQAAAALSELMVGSGQQAVDQLARVEQDLANELERLDENRAAQAQTGEQIARARAGIETDLSELGELRDELAAELSDLERSLAELEQIHTNRQRAQLEQARLKKAQLEQAQAEQAQAQQTEIERRQIAVEQQRAQAVATLASTVARGVPPTSVVPTGIAPSPIAPSPVTASPPEPGPVPTAVPTAVPTVPTAVPTVPTGVPTAVPTVGPVTPAGERAMVCPLAGPFTHTNDFDAPRAVGGIHRANDLIADTGTPVLAVVSGAIEHRDSSVGGRSAHLRGDDGNYYFYTHLNGYENVGSGHVSAGTTIGYVGMTGNAPIPHLHFEIHRGGYGNYTNPFGPVKAACGT